MNKLFQNDFHDSGEMEAGRRLRQAALTPARSSWNHENLVRTWRLADSGGAGLRRRCARPAAMESAPL